MAAADLPINLLDAIVIVVLLVSGIFAFMRGLTKEVLSIFAWVGAAVAVLQGYLPLQPYVRTYIEPNWVADIATAGGIFLLSLIVLTLIGHSISKQVQASAIGALDRSLGFLFGIARGAVIVTIAYLAYIWATEPEQRPGWSQEARSLILIETSGDMMRRLVPNWKTTTDALYLPNSILSDEMINARPGSQVFRNLEQQRETQTTREPVEKTNEDKEGESGYKAFERRLLDRVIQTTQEK